jgi:hypothetical protein
MTGKHHGKESQSELIKRFVEQLGGNYEKQFPDGKISDDDEGDLAFAIAADPRRQLIIIRFAQPTHWFAMGPEQAEQVIGHLNDKLLELKGIAPE